MVDGSGARRFAIRLDPPARARTCGVPVGVERLGLGLEEPDGFFAALRVPAPA